MTTTRHTRPGNPVPSATTRAQNTAENPHSSKETTAAVTAAVRFEEKKARAAALHESIAVQVEQLRDDGRWAAFPTSVQAFHAYSLNNVLLIATQYPGARQVAGFRAWQGLGRQVRRGEKAIRIFGYSQKTVTREDDDGEEIQTRVARFPVLSVFDIAQTDPIDGHPDATLTAQLTGAEDHGIRDTLTGYLIREGWTVTRRELTGGRNGSTDPAARAIVLGTHLGPEHAAKTLIHETAHVLLGHVDDLAEYAAHRGLAETEAESVAYVVAGLAGFDTAAYSIGYVAGWSTADPAMIRSTAARVLAVAHQIAGILCPDPEARPPRENPAAGAVGR